MSLTAPVRIMPRLFAALTLVLALFAPAVFALPASAVPEATPKVTVSKTTFVGDEEATVTVTGTGFDPSLAVGARPPLAGKSSGAYVIFGAFKDSWRPSQGADSQNRNPIVEQKWAVLADDMSGIGGDDSGAIELTPEGNFTAELTVSKALLEAKLGSLTLDDVNAGIYTYAGSGASVGSYETFTAITFEDAGSEDGEDGGSDDGGEDGGSDGGGDNGGEDSGEDDSEEPPVKADPSVTVSKTKIISGEEAVVTVTGANFDPALATGVRPPLAGKPAGAYAVFGAFEDDWAPSKGNGSGTRPVNAGQKWAVLAEDMATIGGDRAGAIELTPEGTFTAELTVSKALVEGKAAEKELSLDDLNVGIYTYGGSGANVAEYETFTPIEFKDPSVTVSQTEFFGDDEVVITVEGQDFLPSLATGVRPPLAGKAAGAYAVFGAFEDDWAPSKGFGSNTRPVNAGQKWAVLADDMATIGGDRAGAIELSADGSFTAHLAVSKELVADKAAEKELSLDDLNVGIYTYGGSGANVAAYETFTPIEFKDIVPTVSVSKTEFIGDEEAVVTVAGTNFDPSLATGVRPPLAGKPAGAYAVFGAFEDDWAPSAGNGSGTRPVNAGQKWAVLAEDMATIGGDRAGAIELTAEGGFTAELTVSKALIEGKAAEKELSLDDLNVGIYTYGGSGANVAAYETFTPIEFKNAGPSVTVSKTVFEAGEEAVVTVQGTNFDPSLATGVRAPLAGKAAGAYVVFGAFEDDWRASEGNGSGTRPVNAGQKWAVLADDMATIGGPAAGAIELSADGSFTADLAVSKELLESKLAGRSLDDLNVGIYTYAGSGANVASYETFTPITFKAAGPVKAKVSVSKTKFDADKDYKITVKGTGFDPAIATGTRPPLAGKAAGSYVVLGAFEQVWEPSKNIGSEKRPVNAGQKWAVLAEDMATIGGPGAGAIELTPEGTFTAQFEVSKELLEEKAAEKNLSLKDLKVGIFTYAGSGADVAAYETYTPLTFDGEFKNPTTPKPDNNKGAAGSLSWGIASGWINYVESNVQDGEVSTKGGVKRSSGKFIFGQKSTTAEPPSPVGTTTYRGSVNVWGHAGVMNVTLNEPAIKVLNANQAQLTAAVAGKGRVHVANLDLSRASKSTGKGTVTFSGAPATLTARGASDVFAGFYSAGKSLDAVTFTIGTNAKASSASSVSTSAAADKDWEPPAEPPASEGLEVSESEVKAGQTITATASGFFPGEKNIKVVLYSKPTILATDVQADASGRATWTGVIPGLEAGEHTLTFQGSKSFGAVITIAEEEIVGKCEVTDATLNWGFKEKFRSYVSGMIARGDWDAYNGASYETPEFIWTNGDGSVDTKQGQINFKGSIDFNGHGGALDMTVDDPKIVFEGSDNATLIMDYAASDIAEAIAGKGKKEASPQTPLVSMELSAAERTVDGNTVTLAKIPTRLLGPGAALLTQYGEGERFDDATLVYTVAEGCDPESAVSEKATASVSKQVLEAQGGVPVFWIAGGTLAVLALIIGGIAWLLMRRRSAGV